jgi:hypothetical protein
MKKEYASPKLVEYGRIADCTFQVPGNSTKSNNLSCELDSFGEHSCPGPSAGS